LTENRVKPMRPKALCAFIQGIEGEHGERAPGRRPSAQRRAADLSPLAWCSVRLWPS
jgi:hypothetical protein